MIFKYSQSPDLPSISFFPCNWSEEPRILFIRKKFYCSLYRQRTERVICLFLDAWDYHVKDQLLFVLYCDGSPFRAQVRGSAWGLVHLLLSVLPLLLGSRHSTRHTQPPSFSPHAPPAAGCTHCSPDLGPATLCQGEGATVLPVLNLSLCADSETTLASYHLLCLLPRVVFLTNQAPAGRGLCGNKEKQLTAWFVWIHFVQNPISNNRYSFEAIKTIAHV